MLDLLLTDLLMSGHQLWFTTEEKKLVCVLDHKYRGMGDEPLESLERAVEAMKADIPAGVRRP
jgi:hypothetical protein